MQNYCCQKVWFKSLYVGFCPQMQTYAKLVISALGLSNSSWTETLVPSIKYVIRSIFESIKAGLFNLGWPNYFSSSGLHWNFCCGTTEFLNEMMKLLLFILHVHYHYELSLTAYITLMSESTVECFIWVRTQTDILIWAWLNGKFYLWIRPYLSFVNYRN